eukprot:gene23789-biopygen11861
MQCVGQAERRGRPGLPETQIDRHCRVVNSLSAEGWCKQRPGAQHPQLQRLQFLEAWIEMQTLDLRCFLTRLPQPVHSSEEVVQSRGAQAAHAAHAEGEVPGAFALEPLYTRVFVSAIRSIKRALGLNWRSRVPGDAAARPARP